MAYEAVCGASTVLEELRVATTAGSLVPGDCRTNSPTCVSVSFRLKVGHSLPGGESRRPQGGDNSTLNTGRRGGRAGGWKRMCGRDARTTIFCMKFRPTLWCGRLARTWADGKFEIPRGSDASGGLTVGNSPLGADRAEIEN